MREYEDHLFQQGYAKTTIIYYVRYQNVFTILCEKKI
jgi:hypothetical protein